MVHLVPSRQTFRAKDVAELIFENVYSKHGLPKSIVSDRDSLFTSTFWDHLHKLIGPKLRMSSSYHPETDGATERANRTLGQMLRTCIGPKQKDWATRLPGIEFAINSAQSETTGYTPFFLNTGRTPRPMVWDSDNAQYPGVRAFALKMKEAVMSAHDAIIGARVKQTRLANKRRRPAPFKERDFVYVSTKNLSLPKNRSRKLMPKYIGPYEILKDYGNSTYRVKLPAELLRRGIHDAFHASLLRIHVPNDDRRFPGRDISQIAVWGYNDGEWAIDRIIAHAGKGAAAQFEVLWKAGDKSWARYEELKGLNAMDAYLEACGVKRANDLPEGNAIAPEEVKIAIGLMSVWNCIMDYDPAKCEPSDIKDGKFREGNTNKDMPTRSIVEQARETIFLAFARDVVEGRDNGSAPPPGYADWAKGLRTGGRGGQQPPGRRDKNPATKLKEPESKANDLVLTLAKNQAEMGRLAVQTLIKQNTSRAPGPTYSRGFLKQMNENKSRGKGSSNRGHGYRGGGGGGGRSGNRGNGRQRGNDTYIPNRHHRRRSRERRYNTPHIDDDNRSTSLPSLIGPDDPRYVNYYDSEDEEPTGDAANKNPAITVYADDIVVNHNLAVNTPIESNNEGHTAHNQTHHTATDDTISDTTFNPTTFSQNDIQMNTEEIETAAEDLTAWATGSAFTEQDIAALEAEGFLTVNNAI